MTAPAPLGYAVVSTLESSSWFGHCIHCDVFGLASTYWLMSWPLTDVFIVHTPEGSVERRSAGNAPLTQPDWYQRLFPGSASRVGPENSCASSWIAVTEKTMIPAPVGVHELWLHCACQPK